MNEQTLKTDIEKALEIGLSGEPANLRAAMARADGGADIAMKHTDIRHTSPARSLPPQPIRGVSADTSNVRTLIASSGNLLRELRDQILREETQYRSACVAVMERAEDELASLRESHERRMHDLRGAKRKIEALRDA